VKVVTEKVLEKNKNILVPIPRKIVKDVGLQPGGYVEVTDDGYRIIITPKISKGDRAKEYTEEELDKLEKLAKEKGGKTFKSGEAFLKYLRKLSKK
jgi:bifunctional DNA-binding transcriptional regulator/antitoxin component of YhaV-PrlF toxin-antitoxin module